MCTFENYSLIPKREGPESERKRRQKPPTFSNNFDQIDLYFRRLNFLSQRD